MKPRFTLRDLFCVVVLCAVSVAWWMNYRSSRYLQHRVEVLRMMYDTLSDRLEDVEGELKSIPDADGLSYSGQIVEEVIEPSDTQSATDAKLAVPPKEAP